MASILLCTLGRQWKGLLCVIVRSLRTEAKPPSSTRQEFMRPTDAFWQNHILPRLPLTLSPSILFSSPSLPLSSAWTPCLQFPILLLPCFSVFFVSVCLPVFRLSLHSLSPLQYGLQYSWVMPVNVCVCVCCVHTRTCMCESVCVYGYKGLVACSSNPSVWPTLCRWNCLHQWGWHHGWE